MNVVLILIGVICWSLLAAVVCVALGRAAANGDRKAGRP